MDRRSFLALTGRSSQYLVAGALLGACGRGGRAGPLIPAPDSQPDRRNSQGRSELADLGPLNPPDANGLRLPQGFTSRIVATSGKAPLGAAGYPWHGAPDGGATFATDDGGWIYVSNSELAGENGGVGALRFDGSGRLVDAYPILTGTSRNCAGGATPWKTWLSCEEVVDGLVWECDPAGRDPAVARPALGRFNHEAVAIDPDTRQLYLTEDEPDGRWYRFTPGSVGADGRADLGSGILEVASYRDGILVWLAVEDPSGSSTPTRYQVPESTAFDGAEGTAYHGGFVYFSTKGDNRVWAYEVATARLSIVYDAVTAANPILTGVDNLAVNDAGDILVAEDGGDMQIVVLTASGTAVPLVQVTGHFRSEITGPAFTPDFRRLYFSSQRGRSGVGSPGVTYEVTGPFCRRV